MKTDGRRLAYLPKALEYQKRKKDTLHRHRRNGDLSRARKGGLSTAKAMMIIAAMLPFGIIFAILSGLYSIEKMIGLRK